MKTLSALDARPKMSVVLRLFLDLYERAPTLLALTLDDHDPLGMLYELNSNVTLRDQYALLLKAQKDAQTEILAKTLIHTSQEDLRNVMLRERIEELSSDSKYGQDTQAPYHPLPDLYPDIEEVQRLIDSGFSRRDYDTLMTKTHGISVSEYKKRQDADLHREELSRKKLDAELLRFFADRIDQITDAIEQFDNTKFDLLLPEELVAPFRELHISAVLGNYGTACILCGALLERTLQDLIPSKSLLNDLIKEAKISGLLKGHNNRYADRIRDDRNNVVHGKVNFDSISSDHALETVSCTRTLISALYKDRLHEEHP